MSNSSRVMKNTLSLYVRMIILTIVSLFTVRVNLSSLGAADYGLYNVVAGFVSMFSFLSGTLTVASQRFFAIGIGRNDWKEVSKYFSINLFLYIGLCGIVILFAESAGLWFINNKMIIDPDRLSAAVIVYQFSILNFVIGLVVSPFLALLIADENLGIYSIISIVEAGLKLLVAYLLYITTGDRLIIYGLLLLIASLLINGFYVIYGLIRYKQLKIKFVKDKPAYQEVFAFLNWNMIGAVANVCKAQGINIVINLFFGTVINAARGIAFQINSVVSSFSLNFMKAIDPQITKSYAAGDKNKFFEITCIASKISFFLLFIIAMPLITNMKFVIELWLKEVPEYTIIFAKLALIDALIMSVTDPISTAAQAIGRLKWYQIVVGGIFLLNLPCAYLLLKIVENPLIPFFVGIVISLIMLLVKIVFFKVLGQVSIKKYIIKVLLPVVLIASVVCAFDYIVLNCADSFLKLVVNVLIEVCFCGGLIVFIGLSKTERKILFSCVPFIKKVTR
ncbi:lipopolysaccharide biosynthesis protein [Treponema bryantii]|uniref:lipopolysaccharide biosynthesis protein n=1 Tax=Treponema bryantii TaxID=163 RepID=UPI0003B5BF42|nr:MATE family efflux transporter [Treponema bryantii]